MAVIGLTPDLSVDERLLGFSMVQSGGPGGQMSTKLPPPFCSVSAIMNVRDSVSGQKTGCVRILAAASTAMTN